MRGLFPIGWLARASNTKVPTVRYYEEIGLLPQADRTEGNQRRYGRAHLSRLNFIRHARDLGFSVDQIRELLRLADDKERSCEGADAIARNHLNSIRAKIARLQALESEFDRVVGECAGGTIAECRVIEVLADHGVCLNSHH